MKTVIQRVKHASVVVDGETVGKIGEGLMILLGVYDGDTEKDADVLAAKTANLRIFTDGEDKMNLSVKDVGGECLVISQFTLCADLRKGNRPSFTESAPPAEAERLYEYFMKKLSEEGVGKVQHGTFGAHMEVTLLNNGPVTIMHDSSMWVKK